MSRIQIEIGEHEVCLDRECPECGGEGIIACGHCDGVGYVTTYEGDQILEFLRRHVVGSWRMERQ